MFVQIEHCYEEGCTQIDTDNDSCPLYAWGPDVQCYGTTVCKRNAANVCEWKMNRYGQPC